MIFEVGLNDEKKMKFDTLNYTNIKSFGEAIGLKEGYSTNEKALETIISNMIGETIFQEYLVFGRERNFQKEADIYAVNEDGDLIIFELKVDGHYDRSKVLQVMDYAALYSKWSYKEINEFYKKNTNSSDDFFDIFKQTFPNGVSMEKFNRRQKMIIISNSSDDKISSAITYWQRQGIDIEEYFYRFYKVSDKFIFEITTDNFAISDSQNCWINTNKRYFPKACREMIEEEKAAAHGDRKEVITDTMKGGYIFLYHNGVGIIGAGIATKQITTLYNENLEVDEKKIKLNKFIHGCDENFQIKKYISPAELKEEFNQSFYFANAKVALDKVKAKKLYELCKKKFG